MHSLSRLEGSKTGRSTRPERGLAVLKSEDSVPRISEAREIQSSNMSTDELAIIEIIADASRRLQQGRDVYDPLEVSTDRRDFLREAYEEILDFSIYIGARIEVLTDVSKRLQQGRDVYGPLDVSTDSRDFLREAYEEILDFSIYISARLVQLMRLER